MAKHRKTRNKKLVSDIRFHAYLSTCTCNAPNTTTHPASQSGQSSRRRTNSAKAVTNSTNGITLDSLTHPNSMPNARTHAPR